MEAYKREFIQFLEKAGVLRFGDFTAKSGRKIPYFINAGMSGTPSDIGVVRYNRDVIERLPEGSDHPDILFIEFTSLIFNHFL